MDCCRRIIMDDKISKCKGCGESIRWIKTKEGNWMPCEIAGFQGMTPDGEMVTVFQPHWGNCIKAKQFKKNK